MTPTGTLRKDSHKPDVDPTQTSQSSSSSRDVVLRPELDSKLVLDTLLEAGGDLELACEALGEAPGRPLPEHVLVKYLAEKPSLLQKSLRVFSMVRAYDLMQRAAKVIKTDLSGMETVEVGKLYDRLSTQLELLTKSASGATAPGNTLNFNLILESMPREAASAVKALSQLTPEQLEAMRRAQVQRRTFDTSEAEDAEYESRAVA